MKNCINCGAEAPDEQGACLECGRPFASVRVSGDGSESLAVVRQRPDGGVLIGLGGTGLAASLICFLLAWGQDTTSYDGGGLAAAGRQWMFMVVGGGLFQLGLILLLAGIIVRALWFLPGSETKSVSWVPAVAERPDLQPGAPGDAGAQV